MMTVMLYGHLGQKFGKVHRYDVSTPSEAIKALCATIKGFKEALLLNDPYRVVRGGKEDLDISQLNEPQSFKETIRIIPVVQGSGGLGKIVMGIAMIALLVPSGGTSMGMMAALEAGNWAMVAANAAMSIGSSLIMGGISELLFSPDVTSGSTQDSGIVNNGSSFAFDGPVNTASQGVPVALCYGKMRVGSQVISGGLTTEDTT